MVGQKIKTISHTSIKTSISGGTSGQRSKGEAFRRSKFSQGKSLRHLENKMKSAVVPGLGVLSEEEMGYTAPLQGHLESHLVKEPVHAHD